MTPFRLAGAMILIAMATSGFAEQSSNCEGKAIGDIPGLSAGQRLSDGSVVGKGRVNINIDGFGRAYHPTNAAAGALIHLCNAGKVHLPSGEQYQGSINNKTCTGRFMSDFAKIKAAGWRDPNVGAIEWYGILGTGSAVIAGKRVDNVTPVSQSDGSGFYVSPTSLADATIADPADQSRYVHPLRVPAAVIPRSRVLAELGVTMGTFGAAYDPRTGKSVAFIVGDGGPRVGEATPALARALAGLEITDDVTRANRFSGQVEQPRVVWAFFGRQGGTGRYNASEPGASIADAAKAFAKWGGQKRLRMCE